MSVRLLTTNAIVIITMMYILNVITFLVSVHAVFADDLVCGQGQLLGVVSDKYTADGWILMPDLAGCKTEDLPADVLSVCGHACDLMCADVIRSGSAVRAKITDCKKFDQIGWSLKSPDRGYAVQISACCEAPLSCDASQVYTQTADIILNNVMSCNSVWEQDLRTLCGEACTQQCVLATGRTVSFPNTVYAAQIHMHKCWPADTEEQGVRVKVDLCCKSDPRPLGFCSEPGTRAGLSEWVVYDGATCDHLRDNTLQACGDHCRRICQQQFELETLAPRSWVQSVHVARCQPQVNPDNEPYGAAAMLYVCCKPRPTKQCPLGEQQTESDWITTELTACPDVYDGCGADCRAICNAAVMANNATDIDLVAAALIEKCYINEKTGQYQVLLSLCCTVPEQHFTEEQCARMFDEDRGRPHYFTSLPTQSDWITLPENTNCSAVFNADIWELYHNYCGRHCRQACFNVLGNVARLNYRSLSVAVCRQKEDSDDFEVKINLCCEKRRSCPEDTHITMTVQYKWKEAPYDQTCEQIVDSNIQKCGEECENACPMPFDPENSAPVLTHCESGGVSWIMDLSYDICCKKNITCLGPDVRTQLVQYSEEDEVCEEVASRADVQACGKDCRHQCSKAINNGLSVVDQSIVTGVSLTTCKKTTKYYEDLDDYKPVQERKYGICCKQELQCPKDTIHTETPLVWYDVQYNYWERDFGCTAFEDESTYTTAHVIYHRCGNECRRACGRVYDNYPHIPQPDVIAFARIRNCQRATKIDENGQLRFGFMYKVELCCKPLSDDETRQCGGGGVPSITEWLHVPFNPVDKDHTCEVMKYYSSTEICKLVDCSSFCDLGRNRDFVKVGDCAPAELVGHEGGFAIKLNLCCREPSTTTIETTTTQHSITATSKLPPSQDSNEQQGGNKQQGGKTNGATSNWCSFSALLLLLIVSRAA